MKQKKKRKVEDDKTRVHLACATCRFIGTNHSFYWISFLNSSIWFSGLSLSPSPPPSPYLNFGGAKQQMTVQHLQQNVGLWGCGPPHINWSVSVWRLVVVTLLGVWPQLLRRKWKRSQWLLAWILIISVCTWRGGPWVVFSRPKWTWSSGIHKNHTIHDLRPAEMDLCRRKNKTLSVVCALEKHLSTFLAKYATLEYFSGTVFADDLECYPSISFGTFKVIFEEEYKNYLLRKVYFLYWLTNTYYWTFNWHPQGPLQSPSIDQGQGAREISKDIKDWSVFFVILGLLSWGLDHCWILCIPLMSLFSAIPTLLSTKDNGHDQRETINYTRRAVALLLVVPWICAIFHTMVQLISSYPRQVLRWWWLGNVSPGVAKWSGKI